MSEPSSDTYVPFPPLHEWAPDVELDAVDAFFSLLDEAKASVSESELRAAVEVATRYAAVDTGAIEGLYKTTRGFTRTIATQAATWQVALEQEGEHVARSIADQLEAYESVLDLATGHRPVSESWLRQLHALLCRSQDDYEVLTEIGWQRQPLPKGEYKSMPNNPTSRDTGRVHHYASPLDTGPEMARLIQQLGSAEFDTAHPVVQAAYAHYALVCVHPFADGNGRVARALAAVFLYRNPGVPLVVFADQKDEYIDALEAADSGQPLELVRFVAERVMDTIGAVRVSLQATPTASRDAALAALTATAGRGGMPFSEFDAVRKRLASLVHQEVEKQVADLALPSNVTVQVGVSRGMFPSPVGGYRGPEDQPVTSLTFVSQAPADTTRQLNLLTLAAKAGVAGADLRVVADADSPDLDVYLREIHPETRQILEIKLDAWVSGLINGNLARLADAARRRLIDQGLA